MKERRKEFIKYVLPSVAALMVTAFYIVVDGILVGQGVGRNALGAVNIAIPFTTLLTAFAMMLTIGGATITSIRIGRGDLKDANNSFMTSMVMILILSVVVSIIGAVIPKTVAGIIGATPILLSQTADYIRFYSIFSIFICLSISLATFIRNDSNPNLALWGMVAGAASNIFLDWLFVFPLKMGIAGAAIATGLGQVICVIILLMHFIRKKGQLRIKKEKIELPLMGKIVKRGLPEFITELAQPITILCYNFVVVKALGEAGLSAFSVIGYVTSMIFGILFGVSTGIQPLISKNYGKADYENQQYYFNKAIITNTLVSVGIYIVLFVFGKNVFSIFNSDSQLISIAHDAIKVFGLSLLLTGVNVICNVFFISTKRTKQALIISACRSIIFNSLFIFIIPAVFGSEAIWWGVVVAEFGTLIIALAMKKISHEKKIVALQME